jgi:tetratricopeptide (TPR) repeat protein
MGAHIMEKYQNNRTEIAATTGISLIAFIVSVYPVFNFDIFWHMANGRAMVEQGRLISEDIFSYTAMGNRFVNHETISQALFYLVHANWGTTGLIIFKAIIISLTASILYRTLRVCQSGHMSAFLIIIGVLIVSIDRFSVRPHLFSFLALVVLQFLLYGYRLGRVRGRVILIVVPVMIVIVDMFHTALFEFIFLGSFAAGETLKYLLSGKGIRFAGSEFPDRPVSEQARVRHLWIVVLVSITASLLSPYGIRQYHYVGKLISASNPMLSLTSEFMSPTVMTALPLFIMIFILYALVLVFVRRTDITHIFILIPFTYMTLMYARAMAVFAIVAAPVLGYYLRSLYLALDNRPAQKKAFSYILALFLVLEIGVLVNYKFFSPWHYRSFALGLNKRSYPIGAVEYIKRADLKGNMFNMPKSGGYLAFNLWPERKIFSYNLPEVFNEVVLSILDKDVLEKNSVEYAVAEEFLIPLLLKGGQWTPLFWDREYALYARTGGINRTVAARYGLKYYTPFIKDSELQALEVSGERLAGLSEEVARMLMFGADRKRSDYLAALLLNGQNPLSHDRAMSLIDNVLGLNSRNARLWNAKGQLYYRAKQNKRAEKALRRAVALDGSISLAHVSLGFIAYDLGSFDEAEDEFKRTLQLNPAIPYAYYGLGLIYEKTERQELAAKHWEEFLKLEPRGSWADKARRKLQGQ